MSAITAGVVCIGIAAGVAVIADAMEIIMSAANGSSTEAMVSKDNVVAGADTLGVDSVLMKAARGVATLSLIIFGGLCMLSKGHWILVQWTDQFMQFGTSLPYPRISCCMCKEDCPAQSDIDSKSNRKKFESLVEYCKGC
uniref:Transmembrane protein n=1 Tax=Romanomermis culicivorax TaxID=13658 RepID=A0A915KFC3_ROMCU